MQEITSKKIIITNSKEEIPFAMLSLEHFAQIHEIPLSTIERVNAAISELLYTIIQHGFPKNVEGEIKITLKLFDTGRLAIKLMDQGIPFNPLQTSPPKCDNPSQFKKMGSLGLHLVRRCMDEYNYQRTVDRNIISMSKNQI